MGANAQRFKKNLLLAREAELLYEKKSRILPGF
jgi:hypothetical protein